MSDPTEIIVEEGEPEQIINKRDFQQDQAYIVEVYDNPVRFAHDKAAASRGATLAAGIPHTLSNLERQAVWVAAFDGKAKVRVRAASGDFESQPTGEVTIKGDVKIGSDIDVRDRQAREIGKARLMDSGGVLIDPPTEQSLTSTLPRAIANVGQLDDTDSGTGSANAAQLSLGDLRKDVDFFVDTSGPATLTVQVSEDDGGTWRTFDTVDYSDAIEEVEQYSTAFERVRAYLNQNRNEVLAVSRGI